MTGEEFRSRYELGPPVGRGRVTSFRARTADGTDVMVHFLTGDDEVDRPVLDRLRSSSMVPRPEVRRHFEVEGRPVVITSPLKEFDSFEAWLESVAADDDGGGTSMPEAEAAPPPSDADELGEFTRLFRAHAPPEEARSEPDETVPPVDAGESGDPSSEEGPPGDDTAREGGDEGSRSEEPGEYTRLFEIEEVGAEPVDPEPPPPAPPPERTSRERRGSDRSSELPRRSGGGPSPENAEEPGDEAAPGPGEFTRMFGAGEKGASASREDDLGYRSGPASRGSDAESSGSEARGGASGSGSDDYLSRLHDVSAGSTGAPGGAAPPGNPPPVRGPGAPPERASGSPGTEPPAPPPRSGGPGEFTRIVRGGNAQPSPDPSPPPASPVSPPSGVPASPSRRWVWLAILGFAVAAALLVALVLVLS